MKKFAVVSLIALLGLVSTVSADIYVKWYASYGFVAHDQSSALMTTPGQSILVQLLYSDNNTPDPVDPGNGGAGYVSGDDSLLDSFTITWNGAGNPWEFAEYGVFDETVPGTYDDGGAKNNDGISVGYIYGRVFSDAAPSANDYYYSSTPVLAAVKNGAAIPPPAAQTLNINDHLDGTDYLDEVVVPEPSSLALFGIGTLIVGMMRRKRS